MRVDSQLSFVPIGAPLSIVGGAGVAIPSNIIDLLGLGVGVNPGSATGGAGPLIFGQVAGTVTNFGMDPGVGGRRPEINVSVGTAFTTANSATLKIALQAAPDPGAAGNWTPTTWTDVVSQDLITAANLIAGAVPFRAPWLPDFPANLLPRFLRLLFTPASGTNFSAGTIASAIVTAVRDDWAAKFQGRNYKVS